MKTKINEETSQLFKTDGGITKSNALEIPTLSVPQGGGGIKGIDEKFTINTSNGTASFSIPIPISNARGFAPKHTLTYNSGNGNGIFGLGWSLDLPKITRKTDKGLPQYKDNEDSDTFLFSQAEDLVPQFAKKIDGSFEKDGSGNYVIHEINSPDNLYRIRHYLPRIEGLYARIERWIEKTTGQIRWRIISKENVTTLFGWTKQARIFNPLDDTKIAEWLPEFTFDDTGNCMHYVYKKEDLTGFDKTLISNENRFKNSDITYTNCYIDAIMYGNQTPYLTSDQTFPSSNDYLFSLDFDYGQFEAGSPFAKTKQWETRSDAFSSYKYGFEVRTTRLCKRIFNRHHFKGTNEYEGIVKSLNLDYDTAIEQDFTFLTQAHLIGYLKKQDGTYHIKNYPPSEFTYQKHTWNKSVKTLDETTTRYFPKGKEGDNYQFIDFYNEGLSGILTEQANAWYYQKNQGDGSFSPAKQISPKPSYVGLGTKLQFADLNADGSRQIVFQDNGVSGYFELEQENDWANFNLFPNQVNINFNDANTRLLDLNGDGIPEVVIAEEQVFTWYESLGKEGYSPAKRSTKSQVEEDGPAVIFTNNEQTIFLADMSGDGLTDLVRIKNQEVCYWPNMGYGKFGAKIHMDNSPRFDHADKFDPQRIRFVDIDGSGTTDIIYLGQNTFTCWKNLSGNRFGATPFEIDSFPQLHSAATIRTVDLFGNGVSCIVWTSSLAKDEQQALHYVDLMSGNKPHLLSSFKNNLGKEIHFEYKPSTHYYLEDQKMGQPWRTKLHFPVHCVSKISIIDKISNTNFNTLYHYHSGYYDHFEKEFRGFEFVEQWDSESFSIWKEKNANSVEEDIVFQAPKHAKIWNHIGHFEDETYASKRENEYWYHELERLTGPFAVIEKKLIGHHFDLAALAPNIQATFTANDWKEVYRACKGTTFRKELFAVDAAENDSTLAAKIQAKTPYSVESRQTKITLIQPRGTNKHAVFSAVEQEMIEYHYERKHTDPRIQQGLSLTHDEYGNILEAASIVYGRTVKDVSLPLEIQAIQETPILTFTHNTYTNDVIDFHNNQLRKSSETITYEVKNSTKTGAFYTALDFVGVLDPLLSEEIAYHEEKTPSPGKIQRRKIEHIRTTYYAENLSTALPLHTSVSPSLVFENYQLVFSEQTMAATFGSKVNELEISTGNFKHWDQGWWKPSGIVHFIHAGETKADAISRHFAPIQYTDAYGSPTQLIYKDNYFLTPQKVVDTYKNTTEIISFNYRTLTPNLLADINGNLTAIVHDELGIVKAIANLGKSNEHDEITGISEETAADEQLNASNFFQAHDSNALTLQAKKLLQKASIRFVYDAFSYVTSHKPCVIATIIREQYFHKNADSPLQISFEYSNGLGEVIVQKQQAEPGVAQQIVIQNDHTFNTITTDTSQLVPSQLRWIATGRTVKNNTGNVIKQYEPYFSLSWQFEAEMNLVKTGVTPIQYYDALDRVFRVDFPNGTFKKTDFEAWKEIQHDTGDTVLDSEWYKSRVNRTIDFELIAAGKDPIREQEAAVKSATYAETPTISHFDPLARSFYIVQHNKIGMNTDQFIPSLAKIDAEGNLRSITDARKNTVVSFQYDMLGTKIYHNSMDAGQRWILNDVYLQPLFTWDERQHKCAYSYDAIHRLVATNISGGDGDTPLNHCVERITYGEHLLAADLSNLSTLQAANSLGMVVRHYDTGGLLAFERFDLHKKPLAIRRKLFKKYKEVPNWIDLNLSTDLEAGDGFYFENETDTIGRIVKQITPDESIILPSYNEGTLLRAESVQFKGATSSQLYIEEISYNARRQRQTIRYGNKVRSKFFYDSETFGLQRIQTTRQNNDPLQDWHYTYDAAGNMTHCLDKNVPETFFNNQKITGLATYSYDPLYRITLATGRENNASLTFTAQDNWNDHSFTKEFAAGDPMAVRNYEQTYAYDQVGNIVQFKHVASGNNWTRNNRYDTTTNRIAESKVGGQTLTYSHHAQHGYFTQLPQLDQLSWNFREELVKSIRQKRTDGGIPETTYYQYDAQGKRLRKITENAANAGETPTIKEERVTIDGYERYQKVSGTNAGLERISLSLMTKNERYVMIETRNAIDDGTEKQLVRYQLHNYIGSCALELDNSPTAEVISYEEYHPFGTTAFLAKNKAIKSAAKRYRYIGMERDEETGLSYHGARYYIPWLGRWLNCDPTGIADGLNIYAYCHNNPILKKDKNGKQATGWSDGEGHALTATQLTGVRVFIFYNDDFSEQARDQYNSAVQRYGVGAVAMSNTGTTNGFRNAWENMRGTNIAEVMIMTHGKNQSINLGNNGQNVQFTSTGTGATNISGSAAPNIQDLPRPLGNISNASLLLYTCHSADTNPVAHGSGTHGQGALTGTNEPIAQTFARTFGFRTVVGTAGSVNYSRESLLYGPLTPVAEDGTWVTYSNNGSVRTPPAPPVFIPKSAGASCNQGHHKRPESSTFRLPPGGSFFAPPTVSAPGCPTGNCHPSPTPAVSPLMTPMRMDPAVMRMWLEQSR